MFKKYPEIQNSYQRAFIRKVLATFPELENEVYVLQEKIDGANLQLIFSPDSEMQVASRKQIRCKGDHFYNVWGVLEYYQDAWKRVQKFVDSSRVPVTLCGELFGPGIQNRVEYGEKQDIKFFDVRINGKLMPAKTAYNFFQDDLHILSMLCPVIAWCNGLQVALDYDIKRPTSLNPKPGNLMEGVVIKPWWTQEVYFIDGGPFYLKKKNPEFSEREKRAKKKVKLGDTRAERLNATFRTYITRNRMLSVFSKYGPIEESSQIGTYIQRILDDARQEFLADAGDALDVLDKKEIRAVYNVGSTIAHLLKEEL